MKILFDNRPVPKAWYLVLAGLVVVMISAGAGSIIHAAPLSLETFHSSQTGSLICNGIAVDFEDGIPTDWTVVNNSPGGIVWTTTTDPACEIPNRTNGSGEAACADSDAAGSGALPYDTELVSNPFDLSTWGGALLDVKAYYRDMTAGSNYRFEVDVWDGSAWINELSWDENHEPEDFTLNLSAYAGLQGIQVRFRYFGSGFDWYTQVDDVELTAYQPLILYSKWIQHHFSSHKLQISSQHNR